MTLTEKQEIKIARFIKKGEHDSEFVCKNAYKLFKYVKLLQEDRIENLKKLDAMKNGYNRLLLADHLDY